VRWRQGDAKPRRLSEGATVWHGFITDITERKRIESELQELATTDGLTRLANRRHFMSCLESHFAYLRRTNGLPAAILMFDLDHFKAINDRWGHAVGDEALRHFAGILQMELRSADMAGRLGGEEFAVLLTLADLEGACVVGQRIQRRLAAQLLACGHETIPLTVSIGVTELRMDDADTEVALSRSDQALYRAKKNGRNRIECA
jgi:diguanylate cyclase (GGDEF)-like protein